MIENLPGEVWKDIPETDGNYLLSNKGRCLSLYNKSPKIIKKSKIYFEVHYIDNTSKTWYIPTLYQQLFNITDYINYIKSTFNLDVYVKDLPGEVWKDIPNHSRYLISNKCRVKLKFEYGGNNTYKTEHLMSYKKRDNHYIVQLDKKDYNLLNLVYTIFNNKKLNTKNQEFVTLRDINAGFDLSNLIILRHVPVFKYSIGDSYRGNKIKYIYNRKSQYYITLTCNRCEKDFSIKCCKDYTDEKYLYCKNCISINNAEKRYNINILDKVGNRISCTCPECYKVFETTLNQLNWLKTPNCGCIKNNNYYNKKDNIYKGEVLDSKHILYKKYRSIKARLSIMPSSKDHDISNYVNKKEAYSGEGIKMCKFWKDSFIEFAKWSLDNGFKEGLVIDRLDNNGDYAPYNCQYITSSENTIKNNLYERNLSNIEYKFRKLIYERRKKNWLKEMKAKGYREEELI